MKAFDRFIAAKLQEIETLSKIAPLWRDFSMSAKDELARSHPEHILRGLLSLQRLRRIAKANLHADPTFKSTYDAAMTGKHWPHPDNLLHTQAGFDKALIESVADQVYDGIKRQKRPGPDRLILRGDELMLYYLDRFAARINEDDVDVEILIDDAADWNDVILTHISPAALPDFAGDLDDVTLDVTRSMRLDYETRAVETLFTPKFDIDADLLKQYRMLAAKNFRQRIMNGAISYCLSHIPTPRDALREGLDYGTYLRVFAQACDQPEPLVHVAQAKFIERLNAGKILRFTNADGTDLSMSIDGFTFCNSTTARNVPGSEVFSAPAIDSLNGMVVAKGRYCPDDTHIVENITFEFRDGVIVNAKADKGFEYLDKILNEDISHKRVGEIGIGTNAMLKYAFTSILLSEKTSKSFHIALGSCYTYDHYMGVPVNVNNGNKSPRGWHWDMTTILGDIELDGVKIMENGRYLPPEFAVFNDGWNAVVPEYRPDWCKDGMIPFTGPQDR